MSRLQHFLDLNDFDTATLRNILDTSAKMKHARQDWPRGKVEPDAPLAGKVLALIFEKPSTRTRVSFDIAMRQLGGESLMLSASEMQLGRGESIADTARVLSRFVDAIMIRTNGDEKLQELARNATVPVINGLTNFSHPCQVMADLLTLQEHCGDLQNQIVTWVGDSNNVTTSFIHAAARFGFAMRIASPQPLQPNPAILNWAKDNNVDLTVSEDVDAMVRGASCVVSDTWVSMHDDDAESRHNLLQGYQVNQALMNKAAENAVFMHCLPAHRGEEVTDEVIDGPQSVVFDEAENRLHIQKGILRFCLGEI